MSNTAAEQTNTDSSTSTFVSALIFNSAIGAGYLAAFELMRRFNRKVYQPRTYLVPEIHRSPPLSPAPFGWVLPILRINDETIIKLAGLDAFVFLKFLRMGAIIFTGFTLIGLPILFPVNVINQLDNPGINQLTIGNIRDAPRLWTHLLLAMLFIAVIVYFTFREMRQYVTLRHTYLTNEPHRDSVTARTLLVCSIPPELNNEHALQQVFSKFPGGVEKVWLIRNPKDLPKDVAERAKFVKKLEAAELKLILASTQYFATANLGKPEDLEKNETTTTNLPEHLRPNQREGGLPVIPIGGSKVDAIESLRNTLVELNATIDNKQKAYYETGTLYASAFIQFRQQIASHMAAQSLIHHQSLRIAPRYIEIAPRDIIWDNLKAGSYERMIKKFWSISASSAITLLWAFPVAFAASIASIDALSSILPFLKFINNFPVVVGVIQGILPTIFLAILLALVPIVFRLLSTFEGIPRKTSVTLSVMNKYFLFLVVNILLVTTLAGGIFKTLPALVNDPTSAVFLLANKLPAASTFFISYVLLAALTGSASELFQIVPLIMNYLFSNFLVSTPRDIWNVLGTLGTVDFGVLFPQHSIIFGIGILYSCVAPLILPFVAIFFVLRYIVYLHQFLYVYNIEIETGGLAFPCAIKHIYTGVFIFELTMIGLFFLKSAVPQAIIMVIVLFITVGALSIHNRIYKPLTKYLPIDIAVETKITTVNGRGIKHTTENGDEAGAFDISEIEIDAEDPESTQRVISRSAPEVVETTQETTTTQETITHKIAHKIKGALSLGSAKHKPDHLVVDDHLSDEQEHFDHPAARASQPTVWLPEDEFGVARAQVAELLALGMKSSVENAKVDRGKKEAKGKVELLPEVYEGSNKGVPGENWGNEVWSSQYADVIDTNDLI